MVVLSYQPVDLSRCPLPINEGPLMDTYFLMLRIKNESCRNCLFLECLSRAGRSGAGGSQATIRVFDSFHNEYGSLVLRQ